MTIIGALYLAAICWATGRALLDLLDLRLHKVEHHLLAAVIGAPLISLAVFCLSALGLAAVPVFLLFAPILWFARKRPLLTSLPSAPRAWQWLFGLAFAFYAAVYLANSLAPEKSPDGMAYHLGLVARYLQQHGFQRDTTNMYGFMPQGMEMLYLVAFAIGKHPAAATVHCFTLLALPWLIFTYGRRIGFPGAGVVAAMLVFLSPIVGIDGSSAYNDVALATTGFALFYLLEIWRAEPNPRLLIPIGLLTGFCFSIKYTGFAAALYALAVVRRRITMASIASAAIIALPWLAKNWLWTGNPVAPLFNKVFPNPYIHLTFENFYRGYFSTYALPSFKPLPWMLTVTGELGGQVGPLFLLAPFGLLAARSIRGRYILLAIACFLIPYPANIGARFLIPVLPFVALAIAVSLNSLKPLAPVLVFAAAILAWPRIIDRYRAPAGGWQITTVPWQVALGLTRSRTWLLTRSSEYELAEVINAAVPATATIWSTEALADSYLKPKVLVSYYSAQGESIEDVLSIAIREDLQPLWRLRFRFSPRTKVRILQNASEPDIWSIGEAHFYKGKAEVQPSAASSRPFPWDINLAIDHNPVTRWKTWESIRQGMSAEFTLPTPIDRLDLDCSHDQWKIDLRVEGPPEKLELAHPPDLRRLATQAVKARGIDYLFIGRNNALAADMRADSERWGLTLAATRTGDALYKIQ